MATRTAKSRWLGTLAAAGALTLLAGCGNGTQGGTSGTSGASAKPAAGAHLVDDKGDTLYLFAADKNGKSSCDGTCAAFWPPVKAGTKVKVSGSGSASATIATITRSDGSKQLTYAGHPLYRYAGDQSAGQAKGQGKNINGGLWWMVSPKGAAITTSGGSTPTTSKSSGGGGGGWS